MANVESVNDLIIAGGQLAENIEQGVLSRLDELYELMHRLEVAAVELKRLDNLKVSLRN